MLNGRVIKERVVVILVCTRCDFDVMLKEDNVAWQVSLHHNYQSYVSVGGSGTVFIHNGLNSDGSTAEFGKVKGKMSPVKSKFGMSIKIVRFMFNSFH